MPVARDDPNATARFKTRSTKAERYSEHRWETGQRISNVSVNCGWLEPSRGEDKQQCHSTVYDLLAGNGHRLRCSAWSRGARLRHQLPR